MKYYKITVNGIVYEVAVEETTGMAPAPVAPVLPAPIMPKTEIEKKEEPKAEPVVQLQTAGRDGSIKLEAPMPGKVLSIKVGVGQAVTRGDVILVLEAMKMENEIVASASGVVASINVTAGDTVESGSLLATLN